MFLPSSEKPVHKIHILPKKELKMGKVICVGNQKGGVGYGKLEIMQSSQP